MGSVGSKGFQQFSSEAQHSLAYKSDNRKTDSWFKEHTNVDSVLDDLSDAEYLAFYHWTHGDFEHGEQYSPFNEMPSKHQSDTKIFDEFIDKSTLDTGILVHRRSTPELLFGKDKKLVTEDDLKSIIGKNILSPANLSTSAASEGLQIGLAPDVNHPYYKQIEYAIRVPAGRGNGIYLNTKRGSLQVEDQREFMLRRDVVLKPVSYQVLGDGAHGRPQYKVVLELVKKNPHKYD